MLLNPYELPELKTTDQREIFSAPSMIVTAVAGAPLPAQILPLLVKYCRCCPNIAAAAQILPLQPKYCRCCATIFHKSGAKRLFQEQGADKHRTGPKKCVAIQLFQI